MIDGTQRFYVRRIFNVIDKSMERTQRLDIRLRYFQLRTTLSSLR